jgi:hypothetical protein
MSPQPSLLQDLAAHYQLGWDRATLKRSLPALAFFGGFLWDALTLGRSVGALDLAMLAGYLAGAAGLLWYLGKRAAQPIAVEEAEDTRPEWRRNLPYLVLQFLFGGMFSALFIFYFKSSSHFLAGLWVLGLGVLLVGNEFLDDRYRRFTLTWALFGLCAMLLLNFIIPHLIGSIAAVWFYLSTLAGAGLAHWLRLKTPGQPGRIKPVWLIAGGITLAYLLDVIPPVPLVKKDIDVGQSLSVAGGKYRLQQEKSAWWVFWRRTTNALYLNKGDKVYCVSAVFAPSGLSARLQHRWEYDDPKEGWSTRSVIPFSLSGGRADGYRGYTWKQNLSPGDWRVRVETEDGRTVTVHEFEISPDAPDPDREWVAREF